ncbi:TraB/GumN family protein [Candidatus Odyssella thessalonicensis]|uniref:TraB/GumN family protein n=1 Tax=Candidatus Odyssella thessalonicensis TaxID=84647 RepID=UPI000225AC12|nr:TraB/GumN family protein [Candidatus Odyssella thessalonicensis]
MNNKGIIFKKIIFLYLITAKFGSFAVERQEAEVSSQEHLSKAFLYQLDIEPSTSQPRPPVYLLGTHHDLPHTFIRKEIKDKLEKSPILVREKGPNSKSFDCDELLEFDGISLKTLREEGLVMPANQDWLALHLTSEQRRLLSEKFKADVQRRWNLSLAEVAPAVYYYCLQRVISQWSPTQATTSAQERSDKPASTASDNAVARPTGGACTVEDYFISNHDSSSSTTSEDHSIGLEDNVIRLKCIYKMNELVEQGVKVSVEKLKRCLDFILLVNTADKAVIEAAYEKLWQDHVLIFYNTLAKPFEFTPASLKEFSKNVETFKKNSFKAFVEENIQEFSLGASESVVKRNRVWVPRIKQILKENPDNSILIIVGATHLAGQNSLTRLLQAEGYNFSPVEEKVFNIEPSNIEILRDVLSIKSQ